MQRLDTLAWTRLEETVWPGSNTLLHTLHSLRSTLLHSTNTRWTLSETAANNDPTQHCTHQSRPLDKQHCRVWWHIHLHNCCCGNVCSVVITTLFHSCSDEFLCPLSVESCSEDNNFVCTLLIKNSFIRYLLEKERNELFLKELFHLISGNGSSIATHLIFILEQCSVLGQCWSLFSVRVNLILVSRVSTFNENYSNNYVATGHLPASIMDNRININHQLLCLDPGNWSINTNTAVQANTWFIYIYTYKDFTYVMIYFIIFLDFTYIHKK